MRRRPGWRLLAWSLGLLLVAPLLPATATEPVAASTECSNGWRETPISGRVKGQPFAIVTRKGEPAWIVGESNERALALRWNGASWLNRPLRGKAQGFVGAISSGADAFFGVGYRRRPSGASSPLAQRVGIASHFDARPSRPKAAHATFADVARSGPRTWAVGTRLRAGRLLPNVAYKVKQRWRFANPPVAREGGLIAVERSPKGSIWAVGWEASRPGQFRPYIIKRSSGRWQRSKIPAKLRRAVLTDISFSADGQAWATGYRWRAGSDHVEPVLLRKVAGTWRRRSPGWLKIAAAIPRAISAGPNNEVWVAGARLATNAREARGFVAHRSSSGAWDVTRLATDDETRSEVMDVAATRDGAIATGRIGSRVFALESCAGPSAAAGRIRIASIGSRQVEPEKPQKRPVALSRAASRPLEVTVTNLARSVAPAGLVVRDVAAELGIAERTQTWQGFSADLDRDGRRDAFFSRHGAWPRLLLARQNRLAYSGVAAFSQLDRHGCDWADVDRDGTVDVLCAIGRRRGTVIGRHELSLAVATPQARLDRSGLGISDPLGRGRQVAFMRLDKDRYPEVFIADRAERNDGLPSTSRFYRNVEGRFVPAPRVGLDTAHGAACLKAADIDRDGDDDLLICTDHGVSGRKAGLRVMRNERGRLVDRTTALKLKPIGDRAVAIANLDSRNGPDIVQLSRRKLQVSLRQPDGTYRTVWSKRITGGTAIGLGDASGDGRRDIFVVRGLWDGHEPDRLLINRGDGRGFRSVPIPQVSDGVGDDVIVFDHDGNGRDDFLVLNGRYSSGPIQLIASYPAR